MPPKPNSLCKVLVDGQMLSTRLWLALGALIWALLLWWPGQLFTPDRITYSLMSKVAPEEVWGLAFFIQSIWAYYTLRTGTRNKVTLAMDALLGCVLWTSSTVLCFYAYWPNTSADFTHHLMVYTPPAGMSGEIILSLASWWHLVRHWAEENTIIDRCCNY